MLKNDKIITDIIGFVEKICKMYMEGENEDEKKNTKYRCGFMYSRLYGLHS